VDANHAPQITVKEGMSLSASPGQSLTLHLETRDPDRNGVSLSAWPYPEAGSGKAEIQLTGLEAKVTIPATAKKGDSFHVVFEGTDQGKPALTRYRRVVIRIR
jgi:hypothetical protein